MLHTPTAASRTPGYQLHRRHTAACCRQCYELPPGGHKGVIRSKEDWLRRIFVVFALFSAELTVSYLCTSVQQQPDTLGLSPNTRLVQRGDGVHRHDVDGCTTLDQLLQLEDPALCSSLVHGRPVCPEAKTMGCGGGPPSYTNAR